MKRRLNQAVVWIGSAPTPEQAVPCPTCGAPIDADCVGRPFPVPHSERALRAAVFGFRATAGAPLLDVTPAPPRYRFPEAHKDPA